MDEPRSVKELLENGFLQGTVVVVSNWPWTMASDELWYNPDHGDNGCTLEELTVLGTPKVIWEPEDD
jgi:hypothetical protein